jgi:hypothetical protein
MADIGISYDATVSPDPVDVQLVLECTGTTLRAVVDDVAPFSVLLTPTGNVVESIVSGVAWPLAQSIGAILPQLGHSLLAGLSIDLTTLPPALQTVGGETVMLTPTDVRLDVHDDMLAVTANLTVS